jgi:hypothetical protein
MIGQGDIQAWHIGYHTTQWRDQFLEDGFVSLGHPDVDFDFSQFESFSAVKERFEADQAVRRARGQPVMAIDERLLAAMTAGMPDCAGVAVGLDRMFARAAGAESIAEVIAFPWTRA